ncbi:MAG: DUF1667 domain-containing protein [Clostridia bacterium]|nr:DUF1667 domain-containing protein [Clostridia bacterium]
MTRELICIVCPKGCSLKVELDGSEIKSVEGFTCPRGKQYAIDECTNPMRTVTSTVRAKCGKPIPVKTARSIPKTMMFDCMKQINSCVVSLPVHVGDVVIHDLLGTGTDVVVTANVDE